MVRTAPWSDQKGVGGKRAAGKNCFGDFGNISGEQGGFDVVGKKGAGGKYVVQGGGMKMNAGGKAKGFGNSFGKRKGAGVGKGSGEKGKKTGKSGAGGGGFAVCGAGGPLHEEGAEDVVGASAGSAPMLLVDAHSISGASVKHDPEKPSLQPEKPGESTR